MAKRWVSGTVVGVLVASLWPAAARAQSADPAPIGRSGIVQTSGVAAGGSYQQFQASMQPKAYQPAGFQPLVPPPGTCIPNLTGEPPPPLPDCNFEDDDHVHVFLSASYLLLQRGRMKNHVLAVADPFTFDDSQAAPPGSPVLMTFKDVDQSPRPGYRLAVGLYQEDWMWEATGFYIGNHSNSKTVIRPGQVGSFFYNPPVGFEGTGFAGENQSFLWDNADLMSVSFRTSLLNVELNCKRFSGGEDMEAFWLFGCRFMDLPEELKVFTDDDIFQLGPIPETSALYQINSHNRFLGAQIGGGVSWHLTDSLSWGIETKAAMMANYVDMNLKLTRGDGLVGIDGGRSAWGMSFLTDSLLHLDLHGSWWQMRVGYNMMWLWGVATAQDQFDFNLADTTGRGDVDGSVFYQGLQATLNLIF